MCVLGEVFGRFILVKEREVGREGFDWIERDKVFGSLYQGIWGGWQMWIYWFEVGFQLVFREWENGVYFRVVLESVFKLGVCCWVVREIEVEVYQYRGS